MDGITEKDLSPETIKAVKHLRGIVDFLIGKCLQKNPNFNIELTRKIMIEELDKLCQE